MGWGEKGLPGARAVIVQSSPQTEESPADGEAPLTQEGREGSAHGSGTSAAPGKTALRESTRCGVEGRSVFASYGCQD